VTTSPNGGKKSGVNKVPIIRDSRVTGSPEHHLLWKPDVHVN
jgi:hypothetical protein